MDRANRDDESIFIPKPIDLCGAAWCLSFLVFFDIVLIIFGRNELEDQLAYGVQGRQPSLSCLYSYIL